MLSAGMIGWPGLGYCQGPLRRRGAEDQANPAALRGIQGCEAQQVPVLRPPPPTASTARSSAARTTGSAPHRKDVEAAGSIRKTAYRQTLTPNDQAVHRGQHRRRPPHAEGRLLHSARHGGHLPPPLPLLQDDRRLPDRADRAGSGGVVSGGRRFPYRRFGRNAACRRCGNLRPPNCISSSRCAHKGIESPIDRENILYSCASRPRPASSCVLPFYSPRWRVAAEIPLPEHPRPDFERAAWLNLNGDWSFRFDKEDQGLREAAGRIGARGAPDTHPRAVSVGLEAVGSGRREADIAWYARTIRVPAEWKGQRVFLVVGASDWKTRGWLDGEEVGSHQGGYTPFELELTRFARPGADQRLCCGSTTCRIPSSWRASRDTARRAACGRPCTSRRDPRCTSTASTPRRRGAEGAGRAGPALRSGACGCVLRLRDAGIGSSAAPGAWPRARPARLTCRSPPPDLWTLEDPFLHDAVLRLRRRRRGGRRADVLRRALDRHRAPPGSTVPTSP